MATPRIFVSSTCYDLQEIRFQLRKFIEDFGLEPVMSDFGDIFYNFSKHVQESCKDEIEKCQLFILVIGNNYGSLYFKNEDSKEVPDSVTLQEFRKALETKVFKHIFINKFVNYDYQNYKRALEKKMVAHFKANKVSDVDVEVTANKIKSEFNKSYPFPQDSYKYVFYFLDIFNSLTTNNATINFESFDEIKESLRKQWSGFMYESLTKQNTVSTDVINDFAVKLDRIDSQIKSLVSSKVDTGGSKTKLSFDVTRLLTELTTEDLETLQNKIHTALTDIFLEDRTKRGKFRLLFTKEIIEKWFKYLDTLVVDYKWSKFIDFNVVFSPNVTGIKVVYYPAHKEVPYSAIFDLAKIYKNLTGDDKKAFTTTVMKFANDFYEAEPQPIDDLPF